jgi:hypothetical protein
LAEENLQMTNLNDLIERLEKAEAGSRELDADIFRSLGYKVKMLGHKGPLAGRFLAYPPDGPDRCEPARLAVTSSLDAAIALVERVLPGWSIELISSHNPKSWVSFVAPPARRDPEHSISDAWRAGISKLRATRAPTAPIALCIALLKALQAKEEQG